MVGEVALVTNVGKQRREKEMFTKNIANAMEFKNIDVETLAARINISKDEMNCYVTGVCEPDPTTTEKIAKELNVTPRELFVEFNPTSFGAELAELRQKSDFTQAEFAEMLGVSSSHYCNVETGKRKPGAGMIQALCGLGEEYVRVAKRYYPELMTQKARRVGTKKTHAVTDEDREIAEIIGVNVRAKREGMGLPRHIFAEKLYTSRETIKKIEHGRCIPSADFLAEIATICHCTVANLTTGTTITKIMSTPTKEERETKAEPKPEVKAEPETKMAEPEPTPKAEPTKVFRNEWLDLLSFIDNDTEFRKAILAVLDYYMNGTELPTLADMPEANMVLKMIRQKEGK